MLGCFNQPGSLALPVYLRPCSKVAILPSLFPAQGIDERFFR